MCNNCVILVPASDRLRNTHVGIYFCLMDKSLKKTLFFLTFLWAVSCVNTFAQSITIGNVDPGPYGGTATIAVPITVNNASGCLSQKSTFNLYLSDANGSFAAKKLIGTFDDFYATYVNGLIPNNTPAGNGYRVMVSSTSPVVNSAPSAPITIAFVPGVVAALNSTLVNAKYPEIFGNCSGKNGNSFSFVNLSTAGATVTANFFNELTQTSEATLNPVPSANFTAKAANYTIFVKATTAGGVGTRAYTLINNTINNSFGATGSTTYCLGSVSGLSYNVDITSSNGLQNNYPGVLYNISWGDNTTDVLSICDIVASGGIISHIYKKNSCGNTVNGSANSFEVDLLPSSKYCGNVGTKVTTYAKVAAAPKNSFNPITGACAKTLIFFSNTSYPGDDPNSGSPNCSNATANYSWLVDGNTVGVNYDEKTPFPFTFTTTGVHTVTLHLQSNGTLCTDADVSHQICIQNPPDLKFTLPANQFCLPATLTPVNNSILDLNCAPAFQYTWHVNGPKSVSYGGGTNANSAQPQFIFNAAGKYSISLSINTPTCGDQTTAEQFVIVDAQAVAKLSPDVTLCGGNQVLSFDTNPGPTQTTLEGTTQSAALPFKWVVTGGAYSFVNGTSETSQYPDINFTDLNTYTITVSNVNLCGSPSTATQHITFQQAPKVNAGVDITICSNGVAKLNGAVTGGAYNSLQWQGGTGTFKPGRNVINPTYTPSAAEIAAGSVNLTLTAATSLVPPCNNITDVIKITFTPANLLTSKPNTFICAGIPLNYQITATEPNSTFSWAVDAANTTASASGFSSGSGSVINDVLNNSDFVNNAGVPYNITIKSPGGCVYTYPFVVSVAPKKAVAAFTSDVTSGCGDVTVHFINQSTPAGASYVWDFGDGSPVSTDANPAHTFVGGTDGKDIVYTVTLTASTGCGGSLPYSSTITVSPKTPVAFIAPAQLIGCSPFALIVNNFSPGNNKSYTYYLYRNNDLIQTITATDKNPVTFNPITTKITQVYSLYMEATDNCGTTAQSTVIPITVSATTIVAQMFLDNAVNKGCVPLTLNFNNNSLGGDKYFYTIYDANNVVIDRKQAGLTPMPYTFKTAGTYFVTVTSSNSCTTIEESPPHQIEVYAVPFPDFSADVVTGCKDITVNFTNLTPDDVNTQAGSLLYDWDFGDGGPHAFVYKPAPHTFHYTGSPYTVTLTATNLITNCVNVITKTKYINVTAPPATEFSTKPPNGQTSIPNYRFDFQDQTPGFPISWYWTFGDGKTAVSQNPGHTYADTGTYKVTLTAASKAGCDSSVSHYVRINGVPGQLFLPNAFEPASGTIELRTFKAKGSGIKEWHMQIFNNFSQLIWETTKLDSKGVPIEGWDGTFNGSPVPQGVYVWEVTAKFINGSEWKGNVTTNSLPKRTGVVHLIR